MSISAKLALLLSVVALSGCQLESDDKKTEDLVDSCNGETFGIPEFDITDMSVVVLNQMQPHVEDGNGINFSDLRFELRATTQNLAKVNNTQPQFQLSFFPKANACSPRPPFTNEKVISMDITSSFNFNEEYPAGENLNQFVDVVAATSETSYVRYQNDEREFMTLAEYLMQPEVVASAYMALEFNAEPLYSSDQIFYINIELDSGEKFQLQTPLVTISSSLDK